MRGAACFYEIKRTSPHSQNSIIRVVAIQIAVEPVRISLRIMSPCLSYRNTPTSVRGEGYATLNMQRFTAAPVTAYRTSHSRDVLLFITTAKSHWYTVQKAEAHLSSDHSCFPDPSVTICNGSKMRHDSEMGAQVSVSDQSC